MKRKNIAAMATSIALVGVVAVGGTLALLTQPSNSVNNIFTVGKGYDADEIKLDEDQVEQVTTSTNLGGYVGKDVPVDERVDTNTYENLVAGTTLDKDPTFRIVSDGDAVTSPKSWFVATVDGLTANAGELSISGVSTGWYKVAPKASGDGYDYTVVDDASDIVDTEGVYYIYSQPISAGGATNPLFTSLHVDSVVAGTNPANIVISGTAVEAVGDASFENSRDAVMAAVVAASSQG